MWDSVIIGEGEKGNSACRVFAVEGDHSISENKVSFWISDVYLGLGMTMFKNTEQGTELAKMIKENQGLKQISAFLIDVLLRNVGQDELREAIDNAIIRSFRDGGDSKAAEIRHVLGI